MSSLSLADLNVEFAAPECFVSHNDTRDWLVVAMLPLLFLPLLLLYHLLWLIATVCRSTAERRRMHREARMGEVLQGMYLALSTRVLPVFDCTQLTDGCYALDPAPYIKCWRGGEHGRLVAMGAAAGWCT